MLAFGVDVVIGQLAEPETRQDKRIVEPSIGPASIFPNGLNWQSGPSHKRLGGAISSGRFQVDKQTVDQSTQVMLAFVRLR